MLTKADLKWLSKELQEQYECRGESSDYRMGLSIAMSILWEILNSKCKRDIADELFSAF